MDGELETTLLSSVPALSLDDFVNDMGPQLLKLLTVQIGNQTLAEELTRQTLIRCIEKWATVQSRLNPQTWAFRTALTLANPSWLRKFLRRRSEESQLWNLRPTPSPPDAAILVRQAIEHLSVRERTVITCRHLLGLDASITAEILKCPEATVESLNARGIEILSQRLTVQTNDKILARHNDQANQPPDSSTEQDSEQQTKAEVATHSNNAPEADLGRLLSELVDDPPPKFSVHELTKIAIKQQRSRRNVTLLGAAAIAVIAVIGLAQTNIGNPIDSTEPVKQAADQDEDQPAESITDEPEDQPEGASSPMGNLRWQDVESAQRVADDMLVALSIGEYAVAASLWDPPDLPGEQAQIDFLTEKCGRRCRLNYTIEQVRLLAPGQYEFIVNIPSEPSPTNDELKWPFALSVEQAGNLRWKVTGYPALTSNTTSLWFEDLFSDELPNEILVTRSNGYEVHDFENGPRWLTDEAASIQPFPVHGWVDQGGRMVQVSTGQECTYSELQPASEIETTNMFSTADGRWIAEVADVDGWLEDPFDSQLNTFFFDCAAGTEASPELSATLEPFRTQIDGRDPFPQTIALVDNGKAIYRHFISPTKDELRTADGSLIFSGPTVALAFDGGTNTVAVVADNPDGSPTRQLTISSAIDGTVIQQWTIDGDEVQRSIELSFDGRYATMARRRATFAPTPEPQFLDEYRVSVYDSEDGTIRSTYSSIPGLWIDS